MLRLAQGGRIWPVGPGGVVPFLHPMCGGRTIPTKYVAVSAVNTSLQSRCAPGSGGGGGGHFKACRKMALCRKVARGSESHIYQQGGLRVGIMTAVKVNPAKNDAGFTLIDMLFVIGVLDCLSTLAIPGLNARGGSAQSASASDVARRPQRAAQLRDYCASGLLAGLSDTGDHAAGAWTRSSRPSSQRTDIREGGYNFSMAGTSLAGAPATCNGLGPGSSAPGYAAVADQLDAAAQGRFFGTNADGIITSTREPRGTMPESGRTAHGAPTSRLVNW